MGNVGVNNSRYIPTRQPVFTETMQIGIVVRDLDAALRTYVDDYGIGPGRFTNSTPHPRRTCASTASRSNALGASRSP